MIVQKQNPKINQIQLFFEKLILERSMAKKGDEFVDLGKKKKLSKKELNELISFSIAG